MMEEDMGKPQDWSSHPAPDIHARYVAVVDQINASLRKTARPENSVNIVVVSKRQPDNLVLDLARKGVKLFGENYPEEGARKREMLRKAGLDAEWHLIGPLQSRKVSTVIDHFSMVHSVDRTSIAIKLDAASKRYGKVLPILLQFNVSGEGSKSGWRADNEDRWDHLLPDIRVITELTHIRVTGMMTMPPLTDNPERSRPFYQRLRKLQKFLSFNFPTQNFAQLSMGTSCDFLTAVEEGATFVRIGEVIFGKRMM
ncbi:MAG: YggS family pyridoxal phosphate-dependent enzyme [Anaerolineae bacterium]|nr:YggS family pyridoxal phosphate-dependent enzyme [Anaerolineae bacterium]